MNDDNNDNELCKGIVAVNDVYRLSNGDLVEGKEAAIIREKTLVFEQEVQQFADAYGS